MLIQPWSPLSLKKELAQNRFQASSVDFVSYVSLVPIVVVMMTMVAVIVTMPGVRSIVVAIIRIRSVVSIRIIAVSRIANSDRNLSVRTLDGNESQSSCHQYN
jgi:hypothetical protein